MDKSEQHILAAIASGNQDAFESMFRSWYQPLCRYAVSFLNSREEAEEVVQGMFIQFWEKREGINIEHSLKSYLYRAVRNASLNRLKHDKVRNEYSAFMLRNSTEGFEGALPLTMGDLEKKIELALQKLPEQCRLVFSLSRFEELKYAEIAEKLNISVKTVENQMGKALRIMREQLRDYLPLIAILMKNFL